MFSFLCCCCYILLVLYTCFFFVFCFVLFLPLLLPPSSSSSSFLSVPGYNKFHVCTANNYGCVLSTSKYHCNSVQDQCLIISLCSNKKCSFTSLFNHTLPYVAARSKTLAQLQSFTIITMTVINTMLQVAACIEEERNKQVMLGQKKSTIP